MNQVPKQTKSMDKIDLEKYKDLLESLEKERVLYVKNAVILLNIVVGDNVIRQVDILESPKQLRKMIFKRKTLTKWFLDDMFCI